jgi:GxxExxY protein
MPNRKPFEQEGFALMGAAFEVHNVQGGGLAEEIYQQSLEIELKSRGLGFESKGELQTFYKGNLLKTKYIPDLVVCEEIIVELKAVATICSEHEAQLFNYLRLTRKPVGYLINFGPMGKLEYKRFVIDHRPSE